MSRESELFISDLRRQGYRLTAQRERVLKLFCRLPKGTHLSAEELHLALSEQADSISLATAYRTLKLLASMGLLRELDLAEGHKHYELNTSAAHHHLVCTACGATQEFDGPELDAIGQRMAQEHGFAILDIQFQILGICPRCRGI